MYRLTNKKWHNVGTSVFLHVFHPFGHRQERGLSGDVVGDDGAIGAAIVALGDGAEALLSCSVPDLQLR